MAYHRQDAKKTKQTKHIAVSTDVEIWHWAFLYRTDWRIPLWEFQPTSEKRGWICIDKRIKSITKQSCSRKDNGWIWRWMRSKIKASKAIRDKRYAENNPEKVKSRRKEHYWKTLKNTENKQENTIKTAKKNSVRRTKNDTWERKRKRDSTCITDMDWNNFPTKLSKE